MPAIEKHGFGAPCWFELATSDQDGADKFYSQLYGWEVRSSPLPFGGRYSIYQIDGQDVAAGYTLMPDMVKANVPPHWSVYFNVEDVDSTAARVAELGGKTMCPPMDVMEHGRMVVCSDPEGASFCLWQAKSHIGSKLYGDINSVCWVELATRDLDRAEKFYTDLLGWRMQRIPHSMTAYSQIFVGAENKGGMILMNEMWAGIPAQWSIYVRVPDIKDTLDKVKQSGGKVLHGPFEAPGGGQIGVTQDPQGVVYQNIQLLGQQS